MAHKRTPYGLVVGLVGEPETPKPVAPVPAESAPVEQDKGKKRTTKAAPKRGK